MELSDQQVRALVSYVTSKWTSEDNQQRLIDAIEKPEDLYLHPLFTIHLNGSEDYECNQALLISSSTQVEFFIFDLPITTAMRLRYGSTITFYKSKYDAVDENNEAYNYALLQPFHKGNTYFSMIKVPTRFFN